MPAYDARNSKFSFAKDLPACDRILPAFMGEIPPRSLVAVLYSANTFRKKGNAEGQGSGSRQLSLNLQAIIVLGTLTDSD